mgnify:CR=1 FL=1
MSDEPQAKKSVVIPAGPVCPIPISEYPTVQLAHGGGGKLSQILIEGMFAKTFDNPHLEVMHDGAILPVGSERLAFSTDSFVISPYFFPGGDIGSLAVHGTVNDIAMCGARPLAISVGLILEEGLPMEDLWRITQSIRRAADEVGVKVVTGDTKVVDKGKGDGVYINTTGLGLIPDGVDISPTTAKVGDQVLVSGEIAVHGIAIMSIREGLEFETQLESDSASLCSLVSAVLEAGDAAVRVLRDPTRGGVASALNEIAGQSKVGFQLDEQRIPVSEEVRGACEILGFDPLHVANEGRFAAFVPQHQAAAALETLSAVAPDAAIIGHVHAEPAGQVVLENTLGVRRQLSMLSGEQLPRIC